jgi:hypothetical protein
MSTRIWSFLPIDMLFVPQPDAVASCVEWLRHAMPAYKVAAVDHQKIEFFDCGGNMGSTYCPNCNSEIEAEEWGEWMTHDYDEQRGFEFSTRKLKCCGAEITLDKIKDEYPCMFGRFAIQVTDTLKTYSDVEMERFRGDIAVRLGCPIRYLQAHY